MKINLRKANALAKALQAEAHKQTLPTTAAISIYRIDGFDKVVAEVGETLRTNLETATALTRGAYALRGLLGKAFQTSGIDDLLTEKALLDAEEKLISKVIDKDHAWASASTVDLASPRLTAMKAAFDDPSVRSYSKDALDVRVPEEAFAGLEDRLRDIRRRKSQIADDLLAANTNNTIDVPAEVQALADRFKLN